MKKQAYWSRHPWLCLTGLLLGALALRLLIAGWYVHDFDLKIYNIPWAIGVREDLFGAYANIKLLNYPPMLPFLFHFVGDGIAGAKAAGDMHIVMLLVKLFPVLFDVGIVAFAFIAARLYLPERAMPLAVCWALNGALLLNSSFWGQTDSMLLLFLGLMFVALDRRRPVAAGICFALGCLAKLQMVYFAPVLLLELLFQYRPRRAAGALLAGGAVGLGGWLPFMAGAGDALLPFRIYLGGADTYRYVNLYAANIYGVFNYDMCEESERVVSFLPLTFAGLSRAIMLLLFVGLLAAFWIAHKTKRRIPAALHALVFIDAIFVLTTRMHERYQLPAVMLAFVCALILKNKPLFRLHLALTGITFLNQAGRFFQVTRGGVFLELWRPLQAVCSVLNLLLLAVLLLWYIRALSQKGRFTCAEQGRGAAF